MTAVTAGLKLLYNDIVQLLRYRWSFIESNERFPCDITEPECNVNSIEVTPSGPMKTHYSCLRLGAHQRH